MYITQADIFAATGSTKKKLLNKITNQKEQELVIDFSTPIYVRYTRRLGSKFPGTIAKIVGCRFMRIPGWNANANTKVFEIHPMRLKLAADGLKNWWVEAPCRSSISALVKTTRTTTKVITVNDIPVVKSSVDCLGQDVNIGDIVHFMARSTFGGEKFAAIGEVTGYTTSFTICKLIWTDPKYKERYPPGTQKRIDARFTLKLHNDLDVKLFELKLLS